MKNGVLKGGVIGIMIDFFLFVLLFSIRVFEYEERVIYCIKAPCPSFRGFVINLGNTSHIENMENFLYIFIFSTVAFFFIGSFVAWAYSKFKKA